MSIVYANPNAEWRDHFRKLYLDAGQDQEMEKLDLVVQEFLNKTQFLYAGRVGVARITVDATTDPIVPGVYPLGELLPAGAIITRTYFDSVIGVIGGMGTMDFGILAPGDIVAPAPANTLPGLGEGIQDGTMANAIKLPAAARVTFTLAGDTIVAGLLHLFCEYVYSTV